ncbi:MAG: MerR family transcriptional regulator mercuric resistance operon regulatory protein [Caulobacteraceae bacterium]|nr:MAG: MerR family transcriptional regulator mercuric resistance operon regulatory protein [Caulobacteraceae bacterium]
MAAIGEISARSGVHIETIRYYERIGLMPKPGRSANGRRSYEDKAGDRLAFIRRARDLGFSLDDIRALLLLADQKAACRDAHALATRHRDAIRVKIKELKRLDRLLTETAAQCQQATTAPCPIIEALAVGVS